MSKRITIVFLFTILFSCVKAQEKLTTTEVDLQSYQLFQEGKWKELIQYAEVARKQGIDFFYLQARTGIAFYNQGKYRHAATWFLKAYQNDQSFEWLQEYVYYSLFFSDQQMEAIKNADRFSDNVKKKIGIKTSGLIRLAYEGGFSFNSNFTNLKSRDFSTEVNLGTDYGEGYLLKNYSFQSVDLSHRIGPHLILNHNLTYYRANRETVINWEGQTTSPIRINQFNYYINPVWIIGKKLNISPSLNFIYGSGDVYAGGLTSNLEKIYTVSKNSYKDYVLSNSVWANYGNFTPGVETNGGSINDSLFYQVSSWVSWYPLSNSKLYFTPKVYFKSNDGGSGFRWNALSISAGGKLGKTYLTGQYIFGEMENFIQSNGYLVENFPGKSERKFMGSLYFPLTKKYQVVFRYINQNITEKYQVYTAGFWSKKLDYKYIKQTITAGISWNF